MASETEPDAERLRLREMSASEREKAVLASLHEAASSMHLDIQEDTPLMEERTSHHNSHHNTVIRNHQQSATQVLCPILPPPSHVSGRH